MKNHQYKYSCIDSHGNIIFETNSFMSAYGTAESDNFELRERRTSIRIGKRVIPRYKVLRKITNQLEIFV